MCPSSSSPPQSPVTTLDESHSPSVKSIRSVEYAIRTQRDSPPPSSQPPAPPTPPNPSSRHSTVSTCTSMSPIQPKIQPSSPAQNPTTTAISINSNTSCLILPEPAAPLRRDQPVYVLSRPLDSGIVDPISFSAKSRQSITPSFSFPGACSPAATYDCTFQNSAESLCALTTAPHVEHIATSQRTPNVYINGLPPHCSEQDLFALTRPFGDIKSVRTFTRHISEKPTGYGFVLFSDVKSAQRCIEGLRKHRNLHPSFSKQVHRIPGTEYAQHSAVQSTDQDDSSFKSRMEKLRDINSTNLYIEGLPLSIDEKSLSTLIQPYKIKSSRFFKTKLSNPPRIIAFVRLETRLAAEETIERLHGRMVRGWNDPGCRISVRFADSAEQRELRRAERTLKNGDQSPSRLTIAQAALLNLRGQELQANNLDTGRSKSKHFTSSLLDNQAVFNQCCDPALLPASRSLPSKISYTYRKSPSLATSDLPSTTEINTLLQSIQNGYEDGSLESSMKSLTFENEYLMTQRAQLRALAGAGLLSPNVHPVTSPRGHAQARNGFTPAEELILEAHTQHLQLQASQSLPIFQPILNTNIHGFDPLPREPPQASEHAGNGMFYQDTLPTISEDDFHAMGHPSRGLAPTHDFQGLVDSYPPNIPATRSAVFVRPPSRAVSIVPPPPDYEEPGKRPQDHHQRAERLIESKQTSCTSSSFNNRQSIPPGESNPHPSLLQASTRSHGIDCSSNVDNINTCNVTIPRDKNNVLQHGYTHSHSGARCSSEEDKASRFRPSAVSRIYTKKSPKLGEQRSSAKEELKSPPVISPALTYSSRTPSTLSPATPFFGSFTSSQDAFEMMTMENEDVTERKLKARVSSN